MSNEVLVYTVADTCKAIGLRPTKVYALLAAGKLKARKAGSKTLVTAESVKAYIENLPHAEFRQSRAA